MQNGKKILQVSLLLTLILTGCGNKVSESEKSTPEVEIKFSKVESCREVMRLIGKTTDQMMKQLGDTSINLTDVAIEFNELSTKTKDKDLTAAIVRIATALQKMSVESTFFEGNSM
jgi:PBP1b-binding outer membrane lipoprotein LpoB